MNTRILHWLGVLALAAAAVVLGVFSFAAAELGTAAAPDAARGTDSSYARLPVEWTVAVPAGVRIGGHTATVGFDGQFRRGTLWAPGATREQGKAWVDAVAASWGVPAIQEDGNGYWAAWSPGVGHVRAPFDAEGVRFSYAVDAAPAAFTWPDDWDLPQAAELGFTDARMTRGDASVTYEFDAPAAVGHRPHAALRRRAGALPPG